MRHVLVLAVAAAMLSSARADAPKPADVQRLVEANLAGLAKRDAFEKLGFAPDPLIVEEMVPWAQATSDLSLGALYNMAGGKVTHKLGKPIISVADGYAYFQIPYDIHIDQTNDMGTGDSRPYDGHKRVGGLVVKHGAKWALLGVHYSLVESDKELMDADNERNRGDAKPSPPTIEGDDDLAKSVVSWVSGGFTGHAATSGTLIVSGTSVAELASGKDTAAIVKGWDALHLVPIFFVGAMVSGNVGYAYLDVQFPRPNKAKGDPIRMMLTVVCVREKDVWKWTSLQFSA
jgi:hypothetical protein